MEVNARKKAFSPDTLLGELSNWNRQEVSFKGVFSEEALRDRDFQKMKLNEYRRLSFKYSGNVQSTDEAALYKMLRFQQRKMEKALYPRKLVRFVSRIWSGLLNRVKRAKVNKQVYTGHTYTDVKIPTGIDSTQNTTPGAKQNNTFKKIQGYDLGARVKQDKGQQKGHRI